MFIPKWVIALVVILQLLRHLLNPAQWEREMYEQSPWLKGLQWCIAIAITLWLISWAS